MHPGRISSSAVSVGTCALLVGGMTSDFKSVATISLLDTRTWAWSQPTISGTCPTPRFAASLESDGDAVLVFGGLKRRRASAQYSTADYCSDLYRFRLDL